MTSFSHHRDLAYGTVTVAPSPATSGTELDLGGSYVAIMPATPFYATVCPPGVLATFDNSEVVKVIDITVTTLTITRAQGQTDAQSITVGWQFFASVTSLWADEIEEAIPKKTVTLLSSADLLDLVATPKELVPAPGAGKAIIPIAAWIRYSLGATPYVTDGSRMEIRAEGTPDGFGNVSFQSQTWEATVDAIAHAGFSSVDPTAAADMDNQALVAHMDGTDLTGGDGTATITVIYAIETL